MKSSAVLLLCYLVSNIHLIQGFLEPGKISISKKSSNLFQLSTDSNITADNLISASIVRNESGWDLLNIFSGSAPTSIENVLQTYYSAGFAEGYLLCSGILDSYVNFYADYWGSEEPPREVVDFIIDNYVFAKTNADQSFSGDKYWLTVKSTLTQLEGVLDGYRHSACSSNFISNLGLFSRSEISTSINRDWTSADVAPNGEMSLLRMLMMNAWGDMYTITTKFSLPRFTTTNHTGMIVKDRRLAYPRKEIERDLRCSSLFKILPNFEDVLFAHATWSSYIALGPRTFKSVSLPVVVHIADSKLVSFEMRNTYFSSSPAVLASLDDFYIISSESTQLSVIETTNDLLNIKLFDLVKPESNLCWLRAIVSNNLAVNGQSWTDTFAKYASGTYTNQWQVFDMKLFVPGTVPPMNSFWLLEEVPGHIVAQDITNVFVSQGYWASYNVPYFPDISQESGNAAACKLGNTDYCWSTAPRANIFRARQGNLSSVLDLRYLINYNNWEHDEFSLGDPCKSIACRRDLETDPTLLYPSGATDGKISSFINSHTLSFPQSPSIDIRLGPTHDEQPPFCWSNLKESYVHQGQPDCFEFDWISLN